MMSEFELYSQASDYVVDWDDPFGSDFEVTAITYFNYRWTLKSEDMKYHKVLYPTYFSENE